MPANHEPIITDATYAANLTNEGGAYNTIRLLKNVAGLWLAQQSRATWAAAGQDYDYDQLVQIASESAPFRSFFDPDAPEMLPPGDMPARIREFCTRTGQPAPETHGQTMRAVYESLALKYRFAPVSARLLRLRLTKDDDTYYWSIAELKVRGGGDGGSGNH